MQLMRRNGFTLIELLVSMAVLTVALVVVATVFSITTKTATQAAAYSSVQNWLRQFTAELRQDLEGINPARSILVLRGREIPAGLTPDDVQARRYYRVLIGNPLDSTLQSQLRTQDPRRASPILSQYGECRADILAFITNREQPSHAPPANAMTDVGVALQNGAKFSPLMVTYGHAALAKAQFDVGLGGYWPEPEQSWRHVNLRQNNPGLTKMSRTPAQEWILARRPLILLDNPTLGPLPLNFIMGANWDAAPAGGNSALFCLGGTIGAADAMLWGAVNNGAAGDALTLNLTGENPQGLLTRFDASSGVVPNPALVHPYTAAAALPGFQAQDYQRLRSLIYANGLEGPQSPGQLTNLNVANPPQLVATVIPDPPAELRSNLSLQALPGCVWFQVEFLQPEDPRQHPEYFDWSPAPSASPNSAPSDPPRWIPVPDGATYVFVPDTASNRAAILSAAPSPATRDWADFGALPTRTADGALWPPLVYDDFNTYPGAPFSSIVDPRERIPVRTWPYAIRITVRVTDPKGRLTEPIVRTVVHRF